MSIHTHVIVASLLLASVASAEPTAPDAELVSRPWQLQSVTAGNVIQVDTAAAVFRDTPGNVDIAETSSVSARYQLTGHWASTLRLGFVGNNAPGAALDGTSVGNPLIGARYTDLAGHRHSALFAALALPLGTGGGDSPDPQAARTNAASITARPADEAMFDVNYATAIVGADVAHVNRGFTAQAEATLAQSVRARGDGTSAGRDTFRTRATLGGHLGMFLGHRVSLGADLEYRRWLSHPASLDAMDDPGTPSANLDAATLTASVGARLHVRIGTASVHPGLSYTRGFDGLTLHGPTNITRQTNAIGISVPVSF